MDLTVYYQKIREMEEKIAEEYPIVVSRETGDGGKDGTRTEVPRRIAAKLVVDGMARLASAKESQAFRENVEQAKQAAEQIAAASRVQLAVISSAELEKLKTGKDHGSVR